MKYETALKIVTRPNPKFFSDSQIREACKIIWTKCPSCYERNAAIELLKMLQAPEDRAAQGQKDFVLSSARKAANDAKRKTLMLI